jgi:preprotein translocase subunit SecE
MQKIRAYLEEVVTEMRKVDWPDRKELIDNTFITMVATVIISLFIFVADQVISTALEMLYS